jgi:hypothetical protein
MKNVETAKQILKEINSYSIEIRNGFKDEVNRMMQHIKTRSFSKRLEEFMKTPDYVEMIAWARNYQ